MHPCRHKKAIPSFNNHAATCITINYRIRLVIETLFEKLKFFQVNLFSLSFMLAKLLWNVLRLRVFCLHLIYPGEQILRLVNLQDNILIALPLRTKKIDSTGRIFCIKNFRCR